MEGGLGQYELKSSDALEAGGEALGGFLCVRLYLLDAFHDNVCPKRQLLLDGVSDTLLTKRRIQHPKRVLGGYYVFPCFYLLPKKHECASGPKKESPIQRRVHQ